MAKGKKTGGGSRAGKPNKSTADIKAIAQPYGPEAVATLAQIMNDQKAPSAARVKAAAELIDRGFGKAKQTIDHGGGDGEARSLAFFYAQFGSQPSDPGNT